MNAPEENQTEIISKEVPVERPRRRGRRAEEEKAIANNIAEDAPGEVPFDETPQPELPKRKRREEPAENSAPVGESTVDGEPVEAAPLRRRVRRRG